MPKSTPIAALGWMALLTLLYLAPAAAQETPDETPGGYAALGDSYTAAVGASDYDHGFVRVYGRLSEPHLGGLEVEPGDGYAGGTSGDLLRALKTDPGTGERLATAKLVTVEIGYNDLHFPRHRYKQNGCGGALERNCYRRAIPKFRANYREILAFVLDRVPPGTPVRTTTVPYTDIRRDKLARSVRGHTDAKVHARFLRRLNAMIKQEAAYRGVSVADVHLAFNGPKGWGDPISRGLVSTTDRNHPNDAGHRRIGEMLHGLGY